MGVVATALDTVEKNIKRGHVEGELRWHYITKDPVKRRIWEAKISKGRENFKATDHQMVCSKPFSIWKTNACSPKSNTLFSSK